MNITGHPSQTRVELGCGSNKKAGFYTDFPYVFREIFRVCKPRAVVEIWTPYGELNELRAEFRLIQKAL